MKKLLFVMALSSLLCHNAQTAPTKKGMPVPELKDHVCIDACKDGTHMYAHGEKGHVCTAACMKTEGKGAIHKRPCLYW